MELQQGLIIHIDNLKVQANISIQAVSIMPQDIQEKSRSDIALGKTHLDRAKPITTPGQGSSKSEFSAQEDRILQAAEQYLQSSRKARKK
jgi:hypothetical protein